MSRLMYACYVCVFSEFLYRSFELAGMVVVWYALNVVRKCMGTHALAHTHQMSHMYDETIRSEVRAHGKWCNP